MRRVLQILAVVLLVLLGGVAALFGPGLYTDVQVGAGYAAKQMCSCLYVARRSFDACRLDLPRVMDPITVVGARDPDRAIASLAWIRREAHHEPGVGCTVR